MPDIPNLGWKYYFDYFKDLSFQYLSSNVSEPEKKQQKLNATDHFNIKNISLFSNDLNAYNVIQQEAIGSHDFTLETTYPGLLLGSGYQHEVKVEGELKLGFSFDHTTGLPIIPGSSIKGTIRSIWPMKNSPSTDEGREENREFVRWMVYKSNELISKPIKSRPEKELCRDVEHIDIANKNIDHLELEIFEGVNIEETIKKQGDEVLRSTKNKNKWEYLKPSAKDVFYEGVIKSSSGKFLGNDYITPHINREHPELSPFSDPTPLQFLKVLPGISFRFQFDLKDGILTAAQKLVLFHQILSTIGIGAKTNVGYGQLVSEKSNNNQSKHTKVKEYEPNPGGNTARPSEIIHDDLTNRLKIGEYPAKIVEVSDKYIVIHLILDGKTCQLVKNRDKYPDISMDNNIKVKINRDFEFGTPLNYKILKL